MRKVLNINYANKRNNYNTNFRVLYALYMLLYIFNAFYSPP